MEKTLSAESVVEIPSSILLSSFIHSFLLGIIVTQYAKYLADYRDDSFRKRVFVASVVLVSVYVCMSSSPFVHVSKSFLSLQTILEDYKSWRTVINDRAWVRTCPSNMGVWLIGFPIIKSTVHQQITVVGPFLKRDSLVSLRRLLYQALLEGPAS